MYVAKQNRLSVRLCGFCPPASGKFRAKEKPPTSVGGFPALGGSDALLLRLNSFVIRETVAEDILVCLVVELTSSNLVGLIALVDRHRGA